jgi:uroporphyrinogen III methyltransferase/synthase
MSKAKGKVYLVGAGPGEPDLITLRGRKLIGKADVLVYDYLVHAKLLEWCREDCEKIYVGKMAGFHSVPQEEIEALLINRAKEGKQIVRLKGGDPFIFGRGGEEARTLAKDSINYEIVPGVSASLAAGAYAGIPLTHRDVSSSVILVTGHEDPAKTAVAVDWQALARTKSTLCVYMGMGHLAFIAGELMKGGLPAETPVACVQWASLGRQRTCVSTLDTIASAIEEAGLTAPAIIVVGEVVHFRESISWFEKKPLLGRRVVVTRNRERIGELASGLEALGAEVLSLPMISVTKAINPEVQKEIFSELGSYDWLVFSSVNGVKYFFEAFFEKYKDSRSLGFMKIAAVGEATARSIREYRFSVEVVPKKSVAEELAKALVETGSMDSAKVLVVTGNLGGNVLIDQLNEAQAIVDRFPVYETEKTDLSKNIVAADFREKGADAILFTSSSGVKSFVGQATALKLEEGAKHPLAGSIGPVTSETMTKVGMPLDFVAKKASLNGLIEALITKLNS